MRCSHYYKHGKEKKSESLARFKPMTSRALVLLGTFRNDDGDGNVNVKKATGLITKTTNLHVHYTFWYISLPSLHDFDVKFPDGTFYGGSKHTCMRSTIIQLQEISPRLDI